MQAKEKSLLEEIFSDIEIEPIFNAIKNDVDLRAFHEDYCEFLTNTKKYILKNYKLHNVSLDAQSVIYHKWSECIRRVSKGDYAIKNGDINIYDFALLTKEYIYLDSGERLSYSIYVYNIDYTIQDADCTGDTDQIKHTHSGYYIDYR